MTKATMQPATSRKWVIIFSIIAVFAIALALGARLETLLLLAALLLCPAAMYFGMHGMDHGSGQSNKETDTSLTDEEHKRTDTDNRAA